MSSLARTLLSAALAATTLATASPSLPQAPREASLAARTTAPVGGLWCGAGLLHEFSLEIAQHSHDVEGRLVRKGKVREITGRVEGAVVRTDPQRDHSMDLLAQGNQLRIIGATGVLALATGQFFTRADGATCTG